MKITPRDFIRDERTINMLITLGDYLPLYHDWFTKEERSFIKNHSRMALKVKQEERTAMYFTIPMESYMISITRRLTIKFATDTGKQLSYMDSDKSFMVTRGQRLTCIHQATLLS